MEKLKPWFMLPYMLLSLIAVLHSLAMLALRGDPWWLAPLVATAPLLVLMGWFMLAGQARSSRNLPWLVGPALAGGVFSVIGAVNIGGTAGSLMLFYGAVVGAIGASLYVFWYSRLLVDANSALKVGEVLPTITLRTVAGKDVSPADFRGQPAIWLFYRGNWCPLCMAQIREVAEQYQDLSARGVRMLLISPQPESQTKALASKYQVDMEFLADLGGAAARTLGIYHRDGTPKGMGMEKRGYDADTVLPTVIITDAHGRIVWLDQTDNYRVRPEPSTFTDIIDRHMGNLGGEGEASLRLVKDA